MSKLTGTPELIEVLQAAQDASSDELIARLSTSLAETLELLDQVNQSELKKAIPILSNMASNGDLDRLYAISRVIESAQDMMTDEVTQRLAGFVADSVDLLDRLNQSSLLATLERFTVFLDKLDSFNQQAEKQEVQGGMTGAWRMLTDPHTQQTMRWLSDVAHAFRESSQKVIK